MIVETQVWCYTDNKTETGNTWSDCAFEMSDVTMVKATTGNDPFITGMAWVLLKSGEHICVRIRYKLLLQMWKDHTDQQNKNILFSNQ